MAKQSKQTKQTKQTKQDHKFKQFWAKPIGKVTIIGLPILIIVGVILLIVLLPKYSIEITGATVEATADEDGVKTITARLKQDCNASVVDGYITCEPATIEGTYSSNKEVSVSISENAVNPVINAEDFSFEREDVKTKQVVIRAEAISANDEKQYTITMQNSNLENVLVYKLTVETVYSESDLALLNKIPNSDEIAAALSKIDTVDGYCIVTEENDPNGNLNKTGGYIAAVYFSDNRANLEMKNNPYAMYKDICDQGTVAGGQIEVYSNVEDATKRADYLNAFSGGILSSGDNYVYGTSIIRISNEMTATQMADLKDKVVNALTK